MRRTLLHACERGDPGLENARIKVRNPDYSSSKGKANALLVK